MKITEPLGKFFTYLNTHGGGPQSISSLYYEFKENEEKHEKLTNLFNYNERPPEIQELRIQYSDKMDELYETISDVLVKKWRWFLVSNYIDYRNKLEES